MKLTDLDLAYIAGFLDGDGSIMAQIIKGNDYVYKHRIRVSVSFYQRKDKHWFMLWLKDKLQHGSIRIRKDGISEYTIAGSNPVRDLLLQLKPYVKLKQNQLNTVLEILESKKKVQSVDDFIRVCVLVDKTKDLTYSKTRSVTADVVRTSLVQQGLISQ